MKRLLIVALAVLFVASTFGVAMADRTTLSIDGSIEIMGVSEQNLGALGSNGVNNRVEQKVNLNVDADMTDNVTGHIGLEVMGDWGGINTGGGIRMDMQPGLLVDEAYIKVDELIIEQLSITAGVQPIEYSLRDDGNAMFLSLHELGAFKATLDYDPLYVDIIIAKIDETNAVNNENDADLYALGIEYYLENESKIQVIIFSITDEDDDVSLSEYSVGIDYNFSDDLEIFAQIGGQGGEVGDGNDTNQMAFNLGLEYTFSNVNLTPYVGLSYQSLGGDDTDENWVNLGDIDETIVLEADRDLRDHHYGLGKVLTTNYSALRLVGGCVIDEKTTLDAQIAFVSKTDEDAGTGCNAATALGIGIGPVAGSNIGAGADSSIGTEIDVSITHQLTDDLEVGLAIGYVASGDAIDDTSGEDDALIIVAANAVLTF